jgi:UPF0176 acylphosphatase like domain
MAFVPAAAGRVLLLSKPHRVLSSSATPSTLPPPRRALTASALSQQPQTERQAPTILSRQRRRAEEHARTNAHRTVALSPRSPSDAVILVNVPRELRARGGLSERLARVKVFASPDDLSSDTALRARLRAGVLHLFPELRTRGILSDDDEDAVAGFDLAIGNVRIEEGDDAAVKDAVARFTNGQDQRPSNIYAEMLLRNLPSPPKPLSPRRASVRERAKVAANDSLRMVSFYLFKPIVNPEAVAARLTKLWTDMGILGRVYVATEGINAQLAVPVLLWADFCDAMSGSWIERGNPVVPLDVVGVYLNPDADVDRSAGPFEKLHVRVREKVLADGLDNPLDWNRAGTQLAPEAWHDILVAYNSKSEEERKGESEPIVLDCRNGYESEIGMFEGSEPLGTKTFRESWDWLDTRLEDEPRDKPIMTFCTGGTTYYRDLCDVQGLAVVAQRIPRI